LICNDDAMKMQNDCMHFMTLMNGAISVLQFILKYINLYFGISHCFVINYTASLEFIGCKHLLLNSN